MNKKKKTLLFRSLVSGVWCLVLFGFIISVFAQPVENNHAEAVSLSGFTDTGDKKWDLSSKTAEIKSLKRINLNNPNGVLYKDGESHITVTADEGVFDKENSVVQLKDNVIVKEKDGGVFETDSMEWDSEESVLTTDDDIKVTKNNTVLVGKELTLDKEQEVATLGRGVKLKAYKQDMSSHPTIITCDGKMEIKYRDNVAEFFNNVVVTDPKATLRASYMRLTLDREKRGLRKVFCKGDVVIVQADKKASSDEALYDAKLQTIVLTGNPKLMRGDNLLGAEQIIFYIKEERVVCEPQAQLILFPNERDKELFNL